MEVIHFLYCFFINNFVEMQFTYHIVHPFKGHSSNTGNCTQYSVLAYMGKESEKELIYVYV